MSSDEQSGAQQDSALGGPEPDVSGWWVFLIAAGQIVGVVMFIKLLAQAFDLPGDKLLYAPAIATLAVVTGAADLADLRTFRHLVRLSAVSVTAALLAFVAALAVILIFPPSYHTVAVIVVSGLLGGVAVVAAPAVHRRFGIPTRAGTLGKPDEPPSNDNG